MPAKPVEPTKDDTVILEPPSDPKPAKRPAAPPTDPEHGDLTADYVTWYFDNHTKEECQAKYGERLDRIRADLRDALEGGAE